MGAFCPPLTLPLRCCLHIEASVQTPKAFDAAHLSFEASLKGRIMPTSKAVCAISSHPELYLQSRHPICFLDLRRQHCR